MGTIARRHCRDRLWDDAIQSGVRPEPNTLEEWAVALGLQQGMSLSWIAGDTGLTVQEVRELKGGMIRRAKGISPA